MAELPEYFQYWQKQYGKIPDFMHLHPFAYDKERELFNIGTENISVKDLDPYTFGGFDYEEQIIHEIEELTQHSLLIPAISGPIVTPKLHEWAQVNEAALTEQAVSLMHSVYSMFYDEPVLLKTGGGHMSFEAGIRQDGAIGLQVLGSCACFGPKYAGSMFSENEGGLEQGFAEYELHNADTQAQRTSLYAGLGHLAKVAAET